METHLHKSFITCASSFSRTSLFIDRFFIEWAVIAVSQHAGIEEDKAGFNLALF